MCMIEGILVIIYVFVFDRIVRHTHLRVCIFQTLLLIHVNIHFFSHTYTYVYYTFINTYVNILFFSHFHRHIHVSLHKPEYACKSDA